MSNGGADGNRRALRTRVRRGVCRLLIAMGLCAALLAAGLAIAYVATPFDTGRLAYPSSRVVTDRHGQVLRDLPDASGERHQWVACEDFPPQLVEAFLSAEDKRFRDHPGFDLLAIARAAWSNLTSRRIVSGASTITQQTVRLIYPRERTWAGKAVEIIRAVKAERQLSKDAILEQYLNRVPLGHNLTGVGKAAEVCFGKDVQDLSLAECALLASLPRAPSRYSPWREDTTRLRERRDWVLDRMAELGYADPSVVDAAKAAPVMVRPRSFPFEAPHFVELALREAGSASVSEGRIRTTLDHTIQRELEHVLLSHRSRLGLLGGRQAAALVVDTRTMEVLALAGSVDYAAADAGYNNGVRARRSPGSLLKPFLYGLALDQGHPTSTLLRDTAEEYAAGRAAYLPRNFDGREYGPATFRAALGNSLNLSAIRMLAQVGLDPFQGLLQEMGLLSAASLPPERYGLGLAIGNAETTLEDLAAAYAMLANEGHWRPLRYRPDAPEADPLPLLSPQAAFIVSDILADPAARSLTFGSAPLPGLSGRVAWKTGTSTKYRDAWIAGYTPRYTVAVWTGNFDGTPMEEVFGLAASGVTAAGPIFADLMRVLHGSSFPEPAGPPDRVVRRGVCAHSGQLPGPWCPHTMQEWFIAGHTPEQSCSVHTETTHRHALPTSYARWVESRPAVSPYALAALGEPGWGDTEPARAIEPATGGSVVIGGRPAWSSGGQVRIVSPKDGESFLLAAGETGVAIRLEVEVSDPAPEVTWFVNREQIARVRPPYTARWEPEKGLHRIAVVGPDGLADEVRVLVE